MKLDDDSKITWFVFGLAAAGVLIFVVWFGALWERESISRYGGFQHWRTYKCEVVK
jgi:hypothetical protein